MRSFDFQDFHYCGTFALQRFCHRGFASRRFTVQKACFNVPTSESKISVLPCATIAPFAGCTLCGRQVLDVLLPSLAYQVRALRRRLLGIWASGILPPCGLIGRILCGVFYAHAPWGLSCTCHAAAAGRHGPQAGMV